MIDVPIHAVGSSKVVHRRRAAATASTENVVGDRHHLRSPKGAVAPQCHFSSLRPGIRRKATPTRAKMSKNMRSKCKCPTGAKRSGSLTRRAGFNRLAWPRGSEQEGASLQQCAGQASVTKCRLANELQGNTRTSVRMDHCTQLFCTLRAQKKTARVLVAIIAAKAMPYLPLKKSQTSSELDP